MPYQLHNIVENQPFVKRKPADTCIFDVSAGVWLFRYLDVGVDDTCQCGLLIQGDEGGVLLFEGRHQLRGKVCQVVQKRRTEGYLRHEGVKLRGMLLSDWVHPIYAREQENVSSAENLWITCAVMGDIPAFHTACRQP